MSTERTELSGMKINETAKAVLVLGADFEGWFPWSQIEDYDEDRDGNVTFTVPEWLAVEKGAE